jgi:hypothetical protein
MSQSMSHGAAGNHWQIVENAWDFFATLQAKPLDLSAAFP